MTFGIPFCVNFLEFTFLYLIGCAYLAIPIKYNFQRIFWSISVIALFTSLSLITSTQLSSMILCNIYTILLFFLFFHLPPVHTILLMALSNITSFAFQLVLMLVFFPLHIPINSVGVTISENLLTILFSLILYFFIPVHRLFDFLQSSNRYLLASLADMYLIVFAIQITMYSELTSVTDIIVLLLLFSLMIVINWDILYYQKRYDQQRRELENYEQYLPIVNELIDYIRMRQHDFSNHLQAIQMLPLTHTDYPSLRKALLRYKDEINLDSQQLDLLKINMKLISGFLISKTMECKARKRPLIIIVKNYSLQSVVPEYILIDLLGILIDNALEASPEGGIINLILDSVENKIYFKIRNIGPELTPQLRTLFFQKGYSTKTMTSHQHGLGLYKLKKITDAYNGIIMLNNETIDRKKLICFELFL